MNLVKLALISTGSFILLVAVMLSVMIYLTPAPERPAVVDVVGDSLSVDSLLTPEDSLINELAVREEQLIRKDSALDSLKMLLAQSAKIIANMERDMDRLQQQLEESKRRAAGTKELARTFESMKTDEMEPILRRIDDDTAVAIYQQMSSRSRKKLLLALQSERAALLTERMATGRN